MNPGSSEDALRESEARFRGVADSAPVHIWVHDLAGCEFVNKAYLDFYGIEDVARTRGTEYVHPEDLAGYLKLYGKATAELKPFEAQFRARRCDGVYHWLKSVGLPRFNSSGTFLGYVGSNSDVSDLKQQEEELRRVRRTGQGVEVCRIRLKNALANRVVYF